MKTHKIIAVTGGIGAGKSVVCSILTVLGYQVYDCDSRARQIMDTDSEIKEKLIQQISPMAVDVAGNIDRKAISKVVFSDPEKLKKLNSIVHGRVREDIICWSENVHGTSFIETAILYQSGIDKIVDEVWEITSPIEVKISRVCKRNGVAEEEVLSRINSQNIIVDTPHQNTKIIYNDDRQSLLLQISSLIN